MSTLRSSGRRLSCSSFFVVIAFIISFGVAQVSNGMCYFTQHPDNSLTIRYSHNACVIVDAHIESVVNSDARNGISYK